MKRATNIVLRFPLAWSSATASLVLLVWVVGGAASAQSSEDAGTIQEIKPFAPVLTFGVGHNDRVLLSIIVIGPDGNEDQSLASTVDFTWSASAGELEVHYDTSHATYSIPEVLGTHTVTASAGSACVGEATDCNATFTIRVMRIDPPTSCFWWNSGAVPIALIDAEGNQYEVFAPAVRGRIDGSNFRIVASCGDVPKGEYIGVRMFQNGPASNAGMSHHTYTLSGNQYKISIVDAEARPIASYALNSSVEVCIPVSDELRPNLSSIVMVTKNNEGTLTAMSSSVRISPSLIICGYTSTLPATIAVGIPGTPPPSLEPEPEPEPPLPVTGGVAPSSAITVVWALLLGIALIGAGVFVTAYRRRRHEGNR